MQQKITLMRFLHLGSILLIGILSVCCKSKSDDLVEADWLFINNSTHKIRVVSSKEFYTFTVMPAESHSDHESAKTAPSDLTANDYKSPYTNGDKIIIDDNIEYTLSNNENLTKISGFQAEKIARNYYKFTYTFTNQEVEQWIENARTP